MAAWAVSAALLFLGATHAGARSFNVDNDQIRKDDAATYSKMHPAAQATIEAQQSQDRVVSLQQHVATLFDNLASQKQATDVLQAGYEEELREQIATAATSTFDDYVDTVVPEIFAQADTDMDRLLTKHEFMHWARRHPQSLRWLDNLALYLLASVAGQLRTEDFDDVDDFQITT